jgi:hypothetical protein
MSEEEHAHAKAIDGIVYIIIVSAFFIYHYIGL